MGESVTKDLHRQDYVRILTNLLGNVFRTTSPIPGFMGLYTQMWLETDTGIIFVTW